MTIPSIPECRYDVALRFYVIICRQCGTSFRVRPEHKRRRYCSDVCYARSHPCKVAKYPRWTHEQVKQLRQWAGVISGKQIARLLGRGHEATKKKAQSIGVSLRCIGEHHPHAKFSDAVVEEARSLADEGTHPKEIAAQLGIPLDTVRSFITYRARLGYTPKVW